MVYPFLPIYLIWLGGSPLYVGLAIFLNFLLASVLSIPMGKLSDKYGRRNIVALGCVFGFFGHLLIPIFKNPLLTILFFAIAGIGHSSYGPIIPTYVSDVSKKEEMATALGTLSVARQSSNSIGPSIGGFIGLLGLDFIFYVASGFMLAGLPLTYALMRETHRTELKVKETGDKAIGGLSSLVNNSYTLLTLLSTFAIGYGMMGFRSFLPIYVEGLGGGTSIVGLIFTMHAIVIIAARLPISKFADKTGRRESIIISGLIVSSIFMFISNLVPSIEYIFGISLFFIFFVTSGSIITWVIVAENATPDSKGVVMGANNTALYAGQGTGSAVTGFIIQYFGFSIGFSSIAAILVSVGVLFAIVSLKRKR